MAIPLALSAHGFVTSVGAYAGIASIAGLAVLILMYFVHARETASLRERAAWLEEQVQALEERIAAVRRAPAPKSVMPADVAGITGAPPRPPVAAANRPASALAGLAVAPRPDGPPVPAAPGAPMGSGAPALADATQGLAQGSAQAAPVPAPLTARATPARPLGGAPPESPSPASPPPVAPPPRFVTASPEEQEEHESPGAALVGGRSAGAAAFEAGRGAAPAAPVRARGAGRPGGARPIPRGETASNFSPSVTRYDTDRGRGGRLAAGAAVGLLAVVVVVALILVTSGGSSSAPARAGSTQTVSVPPVSRRTRPGGFSPSAVTVAVLNGTSTSGLAHRVAVKLAATGYRQGAVVTAPDQTRTATIIAFLPGQRGDALHVAQALKLGSSSVQPIDAATQAVACPPPGPCSAQVVVTVGADLATTA